jgi:glycosyltransferase involved in cell wall biosynthesis
MKRLRILGIGANYYVRGGSDRYFLELEKLLRSRGCYFAPFAGRHAENRDSDFASFFPVSPDVDRPSPTDVLRYVYNPDARRSLERLLSEVEFDLAHLQIFQGRLSASILAPLVERRLPIVQTLHDFKPICPAQGLQSGGRYCDACRGKSFWRALAGRCKRRSIARSGVSMVEAYVARGLGFVSAVDRFVAVCEFQRSKLIELGLSASSISTVHNFVDCANVEPSSQPGEYFLYFGRLTAEKGLYTLLESMRSVRSARLVIAGRGPEREGLERRAEQLGLDRVRFVGFQDDGQLSALVRGAIATLLPSEVFELCSMSVLESFAHARPVIASRLGGTPELLRHEREGLLVRPSSSEELADCMNRLADRPSLAAELGRAARHRAERHFGPKRHFRRLREVYDAVLDGAPPKADEARGIAAAPVA